MKTQTAHEQVKFWCDPLGLELIHATYITHTFSRHTHEGFVIALIEEGVEAFRYQGSLHHAPAGSIVVIHPGEVHTGHAGIKSGWTYRTFYPNVALLQKAAAEVADNPSIPYFPTPVFQDKRLAAQLRYLHVCLESSASRLEKESRLLWTFAQLVRKHSQNPPFVKQIGQEAAVVKRIQDYLKTHYFENISLEQLASLANLKPLRLLRVFRHAVGLPPHAYLVQMRVTHAKKLLVAGMPIAEVAADTGFTDQSHLTKHFKRTVGVTPGQYIKGYINEQEQFFLFS